MNPHSSEPEVQPSAYGNVFAEAKRRRVPQVLASYGIAAWTIVQIAVTTFPLLGFPPFAQTLVLIIALVGLPIVAFITWHFELTAHGLVRVSPSDGVKLKPLLRVPRLIQAALLLAALTLGAWAVLSRKPVLDATTLDPKQVAILPFRVAGADPSVSYLQEGLVDLLATVFTGEAGPRASFSGRTLRAWNETSKTVQGELTEDDARRVAQKLGAGQVLIGEVTGPASRIIISASIIETGTGRVRGRARITGGIDSLATLVDNLGADLLADESAEPQHRLATLATTSLPALRAYIEAGIAQRDGQWGVAAQHYQAALQLDSTFVLAALGFMRSASWLGSTGTPEAQRALELVWKGRERLSERDRLTLYAWVGPKWPEPWPLTERLKYTERAIALAPDDPDAWAQLGEMATHAGARLEMRDWRNQAVRAFSKAMEVDSTGNVEFRAHLVDFLIERGDTAALHRLFPDARSNDPAVRAEAGKYVGLYIALLANDTAALRIIRAGFPQHLGRMGGIVGTSLQLSLAFEDAERAAQLMLDSATTTQQRSGALRANILWAQNRGRPSQVLEFKRQLAEIDSTARASLPTSIIYDALYGDGDRSAAEAAAATLARQRTAPRAAKPGPPNYNALCALEQWRLWQGETSQARSSIDELRNVKQPRLQLATRSCAWLLESLLAVREQRADAGVALDSLEAALRAATVDLIEGRSAFYAATLVAARIAEELRQYPRALAAVRRGQDFGGPFFFRATFVRDEARLAALVGDTTGAIRAYTKYLALRSDPEPALKPLVERVRNEYQTLLAQRAR